MISNSSQKWEVGATVKVGFLTLEVREIELTPGDWKPDAYILRNKKGDLYRFVPHNGLEKL